MRLWNSTRIQEAFKKLWAVRTLDFWNNYLLRWGHKVDGSVVIIIFLDEAEGELVVDQQIVYLENRTGKKGKKGLMSFPIIRQHTVHDKEGQTSEEYTLCKLPAVAYTTRDCYDSMNI